MAFFLPLLPLIAQVGPFTPPGSRGTPLPEPVTRPARVHAVPLPSAAVPLPPPVRSSKAQACLDLVDDDAEAATDTAMALLAQAKGPERAEANLCLGLAQSRLEDWDAASAAFLTGRDAAGSDRLMRARLGAMAGNAALASAKPDSALAALDAADVDARGLADTPLLGDIAIDRARALVALHREGEAETALAAARIAAPDSPEAWLLSATLARRQGKLAEAQAHIQRAAELLPIDPEIGLEAGVIAALAGRDEAARKSWQSVITAAPESDSAQTAKGYLAQPGPAPAPAPVPAAIPTKGDGR
jgi:tetratricopeptide (TPR) repeat protein